MSDNLDFQAEFQRHALRAYLGFFLMIAAAAVLLNARFAWFQVPSSAAQGAFAALAATGLVLWIQGQKRLEALRERWGREFDEEMRRRLGPPSD